MKNDKCETQVVHNHGYSLIELLIVLVVISILAAFAVPLLSGHKKAYAAEDQALQVVDLLQEAKQRALTQKETMRVEFNTVDNAVHLIDENQAGNDSDDELVRSVSYAQGVRVGAKPSNITPVSGLYTPPEPMPVQELTFQPSSHPSSSGQSCAVLRFTLTGLVLNAGTNATGAGATMTGATVFVWTPENNDPSRSEITRAITVLGAVGTVRLWNYDHAPTNGGWHNRGAYQ